MKKMLLTLAALAFASPALAGKFADTYVGTSSGAYFIGYPAAGGSTVPAKGLNDRVFTSSGAAVIQSTSSTSGHKVLRVLNASGSEVFSATQGGALSGTISAATALAANGANCSAGNYPLGVDASGAAEGCTAAGIGDAVLASTQTWHGSNAFLSTTTFSGPVQSTGVIHNSSCTLVTAATGITQTVFNVAYATVTLYTSGFAPLHFQANLAMKEASAGTGYCALLVDGQFPSGYTNTKAIPGCSYQTAGTTVRVSVKGDLVMPALAAGLHNFALVVRDDSGGAAVILNDTDSTSQICVEELK